MKTTTSMLAITVTFLLGFFCSNAQETRTFNQNSSRSNSGRGMSIMFSPVYTTALNKASDSLLFRGSGAGLKFGGDYFFGKVGLGIASGFNSAGADNSAINNFLKQNSIPQDQLVISKSNQQNMYLLLGPSVRWGKAVQLYANAKAGLFINNGGLVSIQQKGAQRAAYRNESTSKSIYPGFQTGLGLQYSSKSEVWSFGFGADYMNTKTEVMNYDARRGAGIEGLKLSKNITDLVAGISIRYTIHAPRDHASGQATGKRSIVSPRDAASGLPTGRRVLPTVNKREITIDESGVHRMATTGDGSVAQRVLPTVNKREITIDESGVHRMATGSCGPVTQRITNPDGTTEEMTFACPDDAAAYLTMRSGGMPNRISMNVTVPKQTQGATFGEKVNAGLQQAGSAVSQGVSREGIVHRDLAARNIISGKLSWVSGNATGIVTNKTAVSALSGGGGGAAAASYAATGRAGSSSQTDGGTVTTLYAREAGSGMATGKRIRDYATGQATGKREKGSGLATGRRQYEPVFMEGEGNVCDTCSVSAKISSIKNNPLYSDKDRQANNPLYNERTTSAGGEDNDCDGVAGVPVLLVEPQSGAVVAKTTTESCGDFFFANVPDGDYIIKVNGSFISKKGYDVYLKSTTDLLGKVEQSHAAMQLLINTGGNEDETMTQKAGVSTSRSNIRSKSITIIEADLDGDGTFESIRASATLSDGSSYDITDGQQVKTVSGGIAIGGDAFQMGRRRAEVLKSNKQGNPNSNRVTAVNLSEKNGRFTATGTFSDGSTRDISNDIEINNTHNTVRQYTVVIGDVDGDGAADELIKTKTKSNQSNDRVAGDIDDDGIWSPRSNIKVIRVAVGDVDGDGIPETAAGNIATNAAEREQLKKYFETGDVPEQNQNLLGGALPGGAVISSALRPGNPIGGLTIKGGKNPGGNIQSRTTNENGEFEFTGLDAGEYNFTVEQRMVINDETIVSTGGTKVRDHNSSRSNKTASAVSGGPGAGNAKVQDHNSSRSNKSSSIVAPDTGGDDERKGDVKITASQNSQSLRSISVQADTDGDGVYETDVTGKVNDELLLNQNGDITEPQQKAGVSTSRSNIRNRSSLQPVTQTIYVGYGSAVINGREMPIKTVYKLVEKATSGLKDTLKTQV